MQECDIVADRAKLDALRRQLGTQLATYRRAAGISQPKLGMAIGKTRSTVSKIEHGWRGIPAEQWKVTDDMCHAEGALLAGHSPDRFRPVLSVVDSNMAAAIGGYLVDMGDHGAAQRYFQRARKAGRHARSASCAAYAAANSQSPSPRLLEEIRAARARMQPWQGNPAVKTLDAQLQACGLTPRQGRVT